VTRRERLDRWQRAGGNWWRARVPVELFRIVHRVNIGTRAVDWSDVALIEQLDWVNRHWARRWAWSFRAAASVAHDAMLEGRRADAIAVLCEIVSLECAVRLTSSREAVEVEWASECMQVPVAKSDDRVDAMRSLVEFVRQSWPGLGFGQFNRTDDTIFDYRLREYQIDALAEQYRVYRHT